MRFEAREDAEAGEHLERPRRAGRCRQLAGLEQLLVDLALLDDAQAVRHLDDADAVDERLVVLVVLEGLPLRLVRVGEDDALIGNAADILGAAIIALLRRRQQRVEHLDRRLEHLDELEDALRRPVEPARVGIGVGIVLAEEFQLADVDLADQRRDVLVVVVARLGLRDADLTQPRRHQAHDGEFRDVAAEFGEALGRPRRHDAGQAARRDAVALLQRLAHRVRIEQTERTLEDRADLVASLQHVDRAFLHQQLETLGERGFAATDRAEEIEDLLAFLQPLRGMAEEADDPLDRLLHAEEVGEGGIDLDGPVHEDAAETLIKAGIDHLRLADRLQQAIGGAGHHRRIVGAFAEISVHRHLDFALVFVNL